MKSGTFRRNHLVPVPAARDLEDLNAMLLAGCREDEARRIDGRAQTVGEALAIERQHLLPLAREGFDLVEVSFGKVNGLGCVKVRTNAYSAPLAPGTKAQIKLTAATVEVWYEGRCVARHARCYGRSSARARPRTLSGRARAQAGRLRRQQAAGAVASSWTLAGELRPVLERADAAAWAAGRDQGDDRAAATRAAARRGTSAASDRVGAASWAAPTRRRCST